MAVVHTLLGIVEAGELIDLPVESDPADTYIPQDAKIELFASTLPVFVRKLQTGLVSVSAALGNGKAVETAADTIVWLLEQAEAATA